MRLYKHPKSPYWYYEFSVSGIQYRGSTKRLHKDRAGANTVMAKLYQEKLDQQQLGVKADITLEECFQAKINEGKSRATTQGYRATYNVLYESGVAKPSTVLSRFSQGQAEDFIDYRRDQGRRDNTIKGDISAIEAAFNKARKRYAVPDIQWPTIKTFQKTRYLSDQEEALIFEKLEKVGNITAQKAADLTTLLVDTGVRLMEGVELEWTDIDLTNKQIEVYRPKTRTVTTVPVSARVHEMLRRVHNQPKPFDQPHEAIKLLRNVIKENCNQSQRIVNTRGRATVHTLRDTFASRMVQRGLSIQELSKLLGHTNINQTMKYAQLETKDVVSKARGLLDVA